MTTRTDYPNITSHAIAWDTTPEHIIAVSPVVLHHDDQLETIFAGLIAQLVDHDGATIQGVVLPATQPLDLTGPLLLADLADTELAAHDGPVLP